MEKIAINCSQSTASFSSKIPSLFRHQAKPKTRAPPEGCLEFQILAGAFDFDDMDRPRDILDLIVEIGKAALMRGR